MTLTIIQIKYVLHLLRRHGCGSDILSYTNIPRICLFGQSSHHVGCVCQYQHFVEKRHVQIFLLTNIRNLHVDVYTVSHSIALFCVTVILPYLYVLLHRVSKLYKFYNIGIFAEESKTLSIHFCIYRVNYIFTVSYVNLMLTSNENR